MYSNLGFPVRLFEASNGESTSVAVFEIRPFLVDHQKRARVGGPIGGNLGYSITDLDGFKVVLSGDTRPCKSLEEEVNGADVAVLEASARDHAIEKATDHGHMTKSEAERIGSRAKRVIYVHQPPEWFV